jgi:hypothetical protein
MFVALAEGACVMVPNLLCSCHLVFLLHAGLYLQLHGLFYGTDMVRVMILEPLQVKSGMKAAASWQSRSSSRGPNIFLICLT